MSHSSAFDYKNELYEPLQQADFFERHQIILPHQDTKEVLDSKRVIKNSDLILAEVSFPSTGQGIELGWANVYNIPIVCLYKKGASKPRSLAIISNTFIEYNNSANMIDQLRNYLQIK